MHRNITRLDCQYYSKHFWALHQKFLCVMPAAALPDRTSITLITYRVYLIEIIFYLTLILLMWRIKWAPNSIPVYSYIQQDATLHSLFICGNCSTCFGWYSTHRRKRIQLYLQYPVFVTSLLLSASIVEELEPVWVCGGWRTPPTAHSNRFQLFHDSGR
jgi:hypothetical protein